MKQIQRQQLQQKLSPQQIQLMRLLQLPVTELEKAIKEEIEKNPLLDAEIQEEKLLPQESGNQQEWDADEDDEMGYDYREHLERDPNYVNREYIVSDSTSATERLFQQLHLRQLSERQQLIATEIIGTLDDSGYLSRDLTLIANDLAFRQGIEATVEEVEEVLHIVQTFDPPGVGARNLRECLLLQLQRMDEKEYPSLEVARRIIRDHFNDFAEHRYTQICDAMQINESTLNAATLLIRRLNPKPAGSTDDDRETAVTIIPDIILSQNEGQLQFYLNDSHLPQLTLNEFYVNMLHELESAKGDKEAIRFLRNNQSNAQQFIDLLQQRHDTIVRVMRYIVKHQRQYLLTGDPNLLKPMRQREVAEATNLDISTVSRMANSKYIQTDFGTIPLKNCFAKGMATDEGTEMSVETIKQHISNIIETENKQAPLSDDALTKLLNNQGIPVARRTVAKYREMLGIPIARLRRILCLILVLSLGTHLMAQQSYYDSIISVRLEKADREMKLQKKKTPARQEALLLRSPTGVDNQKEQIQENKKNVAAMPHIVPLWYDAFPSHRVNPGGKTDLGQMPDEINILLIRDSTDFCFPVGGIKSSPYGWRWQRGHHGVDISLRSGDPVHAAFGGTVRVASRMGGYGNCVVVRHPNGLETLYGHLSKINVTTGQDVSAGEVIGLGGSTGNSTGPHLHFECRFLYQTFDPEWILDFSTRSLRTRRLHLDKSYFGIRKPEKGERVDYRADKSIIHESKKRPKNQLPTINIQDF